MLECEVLGPGSDPSLEVQTSVDIVEGALDDSHHSFYVACVGAERVMHRPEAQVVDSTVTFIDGLSHVIGIERMDEIG